MEKAIFLTPVITAFDKDGHVDKGANEAIYDFLIRGEIDGIVVMGSSGEFFAITMEERKRLIDIAVPYIKGRCQCLVGTSGMNTEETIELSNYALQAGADAVMIVGPYYFSMTEKNIEEYYDTVVSQINGNVYLYNYPDRTGYDLTPELTLRLLHKHKNIIGYKDTIDMLGHTRKLITTIRPEFPEFIILSGFDENLAHVLLSGGNGCIGGLSNLAPEICAGWVKAINNHDWEKSEIYQKTINGLMDIYSITNPFIPIMKKAMILRGIPMGETCLQFSSVTPAEVEQVKRIMKNNDL